MLGDFRWNEWNIDHIANHGVAPEQAEYIVRTARKPWPSYEGNGRWLVRGQDKAGLFLQVAYIVDSDETLYVIHARPLDDGEKRQLRRRRK